MLSKYVVSLALAAGLLGAAPASAMAVTADEAKAIAEEAISTAIR